MVCRTWSALAMMMGYSIGDFHVISGLSSSVSKMGRRRRRPSNFPNSKDVAASDIDVLIRQTGQNGPGEAAIGIPKLCQCQHGFPQVFALDPLPNDRRFNSGLLKLTCPLLVNSIDILEDEGFMNDLNSKLQEPIDGINLQEAINNAHEIHSTARIELIKEESERDFIRSKIGQEGLDAFLNAGVAGASSGACSDVKCLHAWLGDYLFRGPEKSPIGAMVADLLSERDVSIHGSSNCHRLCDPSSAQPASPPVPRNKQRKKTMKELARRRIAKDST